MVIMIKISQNILKVVWHTFHYRDINYYYNDDGSGNDSS